MARATREVQHAGRELGNRDFSKSDVVADLADVSVPLMPAGEIHGRDAFGAHLRSFRTGFPEWYVSLGASESFDPDGETVRYSWDFDWDGSIDHQSSSPGMSCTCSERKGCTVV